MWPWTKRLVAATVLLLLGAAAAGFVYQWLATRHDLAATPPPGQLVDVGGHRLRIWCSGSGRPAVIYDAGLGGGAFGLTDVKPEVARITRICTGQ